VLRVECDKCGRRGHYSVPFLIGADGTMTDWQL
jgi:hypothetical protein